MSKHSKPSQISRTSANVRRSVVIAAGATGMIALGAGAASAATELPASVPLSTPDLDVDAAQTVKDKLAGTADADAVTGKAKGTADSAAAKAESAAAKAKGATGGLDVADAKDAA
ncbi:hypothetical protein P8605_48950, partial [Streptomyces sp. T-3]|nr:hypothetical protein [Streptomyces sp. T-3]